MGGKQANDKKGSKSKQSSQRSQSLDNFEDEFKENFEIKVELTQKERQSVMEAKHFLKQSEQNFEETKYPEALSLAQKSLSIRLEKLGGSYDKDTAQILYFIGEIYQKQGKHQDALASFVKVKQILELIDNTSKGNKIILLPVLLNITGQYRRLKKYKEALKTIKMRLAIQQNIQQNAPSLINNEFKIEFGLTYNSIGNIYLESKQYQEAINNYEKALNIFQENNDTKQLAIVNNNLSEASKLLGKLEEALAYAQIALKIKLAYLKKDDPDYSSLALNYYNYGLLLNSLNQPQEAIENFDKAIEISDMQRFGADKSVKKLAEEEKLKCQKQKK